MKILGIETSCDDTAIAVVDSDKKIISEYLSSQDAQHQAYMGIVPEIAARTHIENIELGMRYTLKNIGHIKEMDAIAVTAGPGLIGSILTGVSFAKSIAFFNNKPIMNIDHLEGHMLSVRFSNAIDFPYLLLLVSGGHTQIYNIQGVGKYVLVGETLDDSAGEAFDKVARMMRLGFPGGRIIEKLATNGDENKYKFTIPLYKRGLNFSFSGLKTSIKNKIETISNMGEQDISDMCASVQKAISNSICHKVEMAMQNSNFNKIKNFAAVGGVASNKYIREALISLSSRYNKNCFFPPVNLCTDNAVMIAWAAHEKIKNKESFSSIGFPVYSRCKFKKIL